MTGDAPVLKVIATIPGLMVRPVGRWLKLIALVELNAPETPPGAIRIAPETPSLEAMLRNGLPLGPRLSVRLVTATSNTVWLLSVVSANEKFPPTVCPATVSVAPVTVNENGVVLVERVSTVTETAPENVTFGTLRTKLPDRVP